MKPRLHLASRSPRRSELLRQLGLSFEICVVEVPEIPAAGETPAEYARRMALAKARAAAARLPAGSVVLGADTDVVVDGAILGKPLDRADGLRMLARLSGRTHEVYSAVALVQDARQALALSVTQVRFGPVSAAAAAAYWDSGEPADKAGAYGIQGRGAAFVERIDGSYSGVVGLPLYETTALLSGFGIAVLPP